MQPLHSLLHICSIASLAVCFTATGYADNQANETLLDACSPYEDMVEFALANDEANISNSLKAADKQAAAVTESLPEDSRARFTTMLQALHKAATSKEHYTVATTGVEVFRLLIDNLESASLIVPKEVSLLDYVGFKLHVMEAAPEMDWEVARQSAMEAGQWWAAIKSKVSDKKLADAVETTIVGLQQAAKLEHQPMLHFAAQVDLDLVDLLEKYFERTK